MATTRRPDLAAGPDASAQPGWRLLGPAFVAAIAYVDPGNVAANISAGAKFGFLLVWVVLTANIMAALVQYLSAKLGLVTGGTLPELVGERLSRPARIGYWLQAELVAIATDLAEIVGGAVGLALMFGLPLLLGGVITGVVSMLMLAAGDHTGAHVFERICGGMLLVITLGFLAGLVVRPPELSAVAGGLLPRFDGAESLLLATAILGATVMPHAVYLHSGLVLDRHGHPPSGPALQRLLRASRWDVGLAMVVAGSVNIAMLVIAAANLTGRDTGGTIEGAHAAVTDTLGPTVALLFALGLLASGLASTSVGCYAGSMIMRGLLHVSVPLLWRRLITLLPALLVLAAGIDATRALVLSQVVLSFGIPFALVPLIRLTGDARLMGPDVNRTVTSVLGWTVAGAVTVLNAVLIYLTVTG